MKRLIVLTAVLALLQGVSIQAQETEYNPIGVQWDANSEADLAGYKVYEKTVTGAYAELAVCTPDTTEVNFTAATPHPDGTYVWVVTAFDLAGNESGYSNEATASFDSGAPTPPTGCVTIP